MDPLRSTRPARRLFVLAAGVALAACSGTLAPPDAMAPGDAARDALRDAARDARDAAPPVDAPSAPDAGAPDAARTYPTDRGVFFGPSRCAAAGAQLCDDFEATPVGSPPDSSVWTVRTWGAGTAVVDETHAARGARAVHIHTPAVPASVTFQERVTFPAAGNHFFGRMFLYLARIPRPYMWMDPAGYPLVHWTAAAASGSLEAGGMMYQPEVRAVGGINTRLLINVDGGPRPEQGIGDEPPAGHESIVAGEWMCFEFEHRGSGATAEMRVWWDGVEHPRMHLSPANLGETNEAWPIPVFQSLSFGWSLYQNYSALMPEGFDVWIDEVAVDSRRIGCGL